MPRMADGDARPGERVEADVVPILGATAERPEADQRELHAEQALVGVRLVGDARLDQPAVATRDDAKEVVALEEVRAGRRRRTKIVSGEVREPQVVTQTQVQGAIQLVHPVARQEPRVAAVRTHTLVHILLDEPIRDAERARALEAPRAGSSLPPGFADKAADAEAPDH